MKCPWCQIRLEPDALAFLTHAAIVHTDKAKELAGKLLTSDVVWIVPTPEPTPSAPEEKR